MSHHLLLAPAAFPHRVHAVSPVSKVLACVEHTYCSNGSKDVLVAFVVAVWVLAFVAIPLIVRSRRRPHPTTSRYRSREELP